MRESGGSHIIIAVHVDDQLIVGTNMREIEEIKAALSDRWGITDLGPVKTFLGMDIKRDRATRTLTISQARYAADVLKRFGLQDCQPLRTPLDPSYSKLQKRLSSERACALHYRSMLGSLPLMYLALCTRPDLSYVIGRLAVYSTDPGEQHERALLRVFRYLKGTLSLPCLHQCLQS